MPWPLGIAPSAPGWPSSGRTPTGPSGGRCPNGLKVPEPSFGTTPTGPSLTAAGPNGLKVDPSFGLTPTGPSGGRRPKGLKLPEPSFGTTPTGPSFTSTGPNGLNFEPSFGRTPTGPSGGRLPKGLNSPEPSFGTTPTGPSFTDALWKGEKPPPWGCFGASKSAAPEARRTASGPAFTTRTIASFVKPSGVCIYHSVASIGFSPSSAIAYAFALLPPSL